MSRISLAGPNAHQYIRRTSCTLLQRQSLSYLLLATFLLLLVFFVKSNTLLVWTGHDHPIPHLLEASSVEYELQGQATNQESGDDLLSAQARYAKRHGRIPPPGWDHWYTSMGGRGACKSGDPYEEMYNSMEIYRTLSPQVIELKSHQMTEQKVLGMGRVRIRKGKVIRWREMGVPERGTDSEPRKVVESMLEELCQREGVRLPDVDLIINGLEEPRVIPSFEFRNHRLDLLKRGQVESLKFKESPLVFKSLRTNESTYSVIRLACPPLSSARTTTSPLTSSTKIIKQITTRYGRFLSTADAERTMWCDQPELQDSYESFMSPFDSNWSYIDEIVPVFSTSKMLGFLDILLPIELGEGELLPVQMNAIDVLHDPPWQVKQNNMYWRGTNDGVLSSDLSWLRWLRTRLVSTLNRPDSWEHRVTLMSAGEANNINRINVPVSAVNRAFTDVAISGHEKDVDSTITATSHPQFAEPSLRFDNMNRTPSEWYNSKLLLNFANPPHSDSVFAPSFITAMSSESAVIRAGLHLHFYDATLIPWYHYVPLSTRLDDLYPILGYFFSAQPLFRLLREKSTSNLVRHLFESKSHTRGLHGIAGNGSNWVMNCAGKEARLRYLYLLVLEWSRLSTEAVK